MDELINVGCVSLDKRYQYYHIQGKRARLQKGHTMPKRNKNKKKEQYINQKMTETLYKNEAMSEETRKNTTLDTGRLGRLFRVVRGEYSMIPRVGGHLAIEYNNHQCPTNLSISTHRHHNGQKDRSHTRWHPRVSRSIYRTTQSIYSSTS